MREGKTIYVIIPALNEENAIGDVIRDIPAWVDKIIVADNGSKDNTAKLAQNLGAEVVFAYRQGYGSACLKGLSVASEADITVFLDGDYSDYPEDMHLLVDPIAKDEAQFVLGSRSLGQVQKGALTIPQIFGNWFACFLMRLIWGVRYTDLGPFRAIDAEALEALDMQDTNYGWTIEMQIKAHVMGVRHLEVPIRYRERIGVSKISGTVSGTIKAGWKIIWTIVRYWYLTRKNYSKMSA